MESYPPLCSLEYDQRGVAHGPKSDVRLAPSAHPAVGQANRRLTPRLESADGMKTQGLLSARSLLVLAVKTAALGGLVEAALAGPKQSVTAASSARHCR